MKKQNLDGITISGLRDNNIRTGFSQHFTNSSILLYTVFGNINSQKTTRKFTDFLVHKFKEMELPLVYILHLLEISST